jgi:seryl-tRNA synthetase
MLKRLKENFEGGLEKIKWFSSLLSERIKIEYSVIKLLYHSEQMEKKRDELIKKIGNRVYELKKYSDARVLKDGIISEALNEIEKIEKEIESTKKKASEISNIST